MTPHPMQESAFKQQLLATRIIWAALSLFAPMTYIVVYWIQVLHGNPSGFFMGLAQVPWTNPVVFVLLTISALTLIAAATFPGIAANQQKIKDAPVFARWRVKLILTCALLESIAIYGLVLGFILGEKMATLSLILMLVPMAGGMFIFPSETEWRRESEQHPYGS